MPVQVIVFGQLTDILGHQPITMDDAPDTGTLIKELNQRYPALEKAPYIIAVDKTIVNGNVLLTGNNTVALLPPFAGG
ncbi:molybdopterin synthase sulfur carrier subunit [Niastella koreensis]|uniref:Thiamine S protein n=2 Tax=Niastella koreensis TaxID=354356 RepID=G8T810_NIAKG|nr:MoaD/ThiS family protein [Niastella koreensis]AEV96948.1 thiamine S protein [Niastella koreensis GR20-10]OQP39355.1 molybdopterin synthase sulfur carrier subunit [Niastella koreensis]